jgi:hypothetical protein
MNLYNQFFQEASSIKEGYESGDILGSQPHIDEMFSNPDKLIILTEEEFIKKCETDKQFSERWGLNTQNGKLQLEDYSLISNKWIDDKIEELLSISETRIEPFVEGKYVGQLRLLKELKKQLIPSVKLYNQEEL